MHVGNSDQPPCWPSWGKSQGTCTYMPLPGANQAAHSGFKTQTRHHQKSKTGVSVALQKGLMSPKILLKMKNANKITIKKTCTDGLAFPETNIRIPRIQFNSAEYLDSSERLFINLNSYEILNRSVRKTNIYWNEIDSYQDGIYDSRRFVKNGSIADWQFV